MMKTVIFFIGFRSTRDIGIYCLSYNCVLHLRTLTFQTEHMAKMFIGPAFLPQKNLNFLSKNRLVLLFESNEKIVLHTL